MLQEKMTVEQIKNFRNVLCITLGPYALIMPDEEVIKLRDKIQERVNKIEEEINGQKS